MAARILISRTSSKTLAHSFFISSSSDSLPIFPSSFSRCLRGLHSLVSRRFDQSDRHRILTTNCRAMVTSSTPRFDALQEAVSTAAALNIDNRVPATVITGFLGSGKVIVLHFMWKIITVAYLLLVFDIWFLCCPKIWSGWSSILHWYWKVC